MQYPRKIVLKDDKLKELLLAKEELVLKGREKSDEIEAVEREMAEVDLEIQALEKKVDISHIKKEADDITVEFNKALAKMEAIQKKVYEAMKGKIPKGLGENYDLLKKKKDKLENERNKIALKVQQKRDKIIPLGRKLLEPHKQNKYEDYDTLRMENGEIVATIFNHHEDWLANFGKQKH